MAPIPAPRRRFPFARHRELVALCALLTFGCTVVRAPASAIAPRVPVHHGVADPQVELWLESGQPVGPAEADRAAAEARAVLAQALAPRQLAEGEQLLLVRAQGVSRTESRRSNQQAAVVGIVVGIVVVAVVAILASQGSGSRGSSPSVARAAPRSGRGSVAGAVPRPPRVGPRAVPIPGPGHHHSYGPGHSIGFDLAIGMSFPGPVPPPPPEPTWYGAPMALPPPSPETPASPAPAEPSAEEQLTELLPPPLLPLDLESRGFFSGDAVRVELLLVDRHTGAPLWVKTVEQEADPRDPEAMRALLDKALDEPGGWSPAGSPSP